MSGLEQRKKGRDEALAGVSAIISVSAPNAAAAVAAWPAIDGDLLDERRAAVPAFPLELLPQPWRAWTSAAARSADAPADYVAQAVLATVAGVSGTRVRTCVSEGWVEPLQPWLAVVGASSTGKSPALAQVGRLVTALERARGGSHEAPRRIAVADPTVDGVLEALRQGWHGKLLWRDGADGCFTPLKGMTSARHLEDLEVSMLGSIEPDAVTLQMQRGGEGMAARFLYAWPHPMPYCPLDQRAHPVSDDVLPSLRRLHQFSLRPGHLLFLDPPASSAFDAFLARLHGEVRRSERLEAAWLGKGRGMVACLAGLFTLMSWSATDEAEPPGNICREAVDRAVLLWSDYYRPHALTFLQRTVPTDVECRARRVVHWLRADDRPTVSKTDVRRTALAQTVNAKETDRVLARLVDAGVLRPADSEEPIRRGRPALRWLVNPSLRSA